MSASTDNNVSVWDVVTGECEQRLRFPSPVLRVQFNPRDSDELLVVPMRHAAVVVRLSANPPSHRLVPVDDEADLHVYASYDKRGKHIFTGNSKGKILIVDRETLEVVKPKITRHKPVEVKEFPKEAQLPDPHPLIYACDLHGFVDEPHGVPLHKRAHEVHRRLCPEGEPLPVPDLWAS